MIAGLPYDAEIEYLKSTGTQYVDTLVLPTWTTDVEVSCNYTEVNRINTIIGGCSRYGDNELLIVANCNTTSKNTIFVKGSTTTVRLGNNWAFQNQDHTYKIIGGSCYFDDTLVGTYSQATVSTTNTMNLLAYHRDVGIDEFFVGNLYYAKIWNANTLVRDLISVRVGSGANAVGYMYDRVTRKLFGNAGTGAFVLGPDVATPVMGIYAYPEEENN